MTLADWAHRWGLPAQALAELAGLPAFVPVAPSKPTISESAVQSLVRLEAARKGVHLFRNNSGAGFIIDRDKLCPQCQPLAQRLIRWGLGNDSKDLNAVIKSADLIGWRRRLITSDMVGHTVAQFVSRECKKPGWKYTATPEEQAQMRWHTMIAAAGGDSAIVNSEGSL